MSGTIFTVSTAEEFHEAILQARGGDTILMAPGRYDHISLSPFAGFGYVPHSEGQVTIRSADPENPASLSSLSLRDARGLVFESLVFDYQYSEGDDSKIRPFHVRDSSDIVIRDSVFEGALVDGFGFGFGLSVRGSTDIVVENNEFLNWDRGAIFSAIENLTVSRNEFHGIRVDGTNFVQVQNVLIENNHFHNFNYDGGSGHKDMIQFWTSGTDTPSTDIVIRGNLLDIGEGNWTQSIFMRNEMVDSHGSGPEMFYQNILIEDNIIYNAHGHGITVGETDGLVIRNNSILRHEGYMEGLSGTVTIPKILLRSDSTNVVIERNVVHSIGGFEGQEDWRITDNVFVQDNNPEAPGYYGAHFITSSLDHRDGALKYIVLPGSEIEALGAGSPRLLFNDAPETVTAAFQVTGVPGTSGQLVFDAGLTMGPTGLVLPEEARFIWHFGDGTSAEGPLLRHAFEKPGHYDVVLEVIGADGTSSLAQHRVGITGEQIANLDAERGGFVLHAFGEETLVAVNPDLIVTTDAGSALQLGGEGVQASIPRSALSSLFGADNFELSLTLQGTGRGEVARLQNVFVASVREDGSFRMEFFPDTGARVRLTTEGVVLNDGGVHEVTMRFSGQAERLEILVGGEVRAAADVAGAVQARGSWNLVFGPPESSSRVPFDGLLLDFDLRAIKPDYLPHDGDVGVLTGSHEAPLAATLPAVAPQEEPVAQTETAPDEPGEEEEILAPVPPEPETETEPLEEETPAVEAAEDVPGGDDDAAGEEEDILAPVPPAPEAEAGTGDTPQGDSSGDNPTGADSPEDAPSNTPPPGTDTGTDTEDHGLLLPGGWQNPLQGGFVLDPVAHADRIRFVDDAHAVLHETGYTIHLDGHRDSVNLGRMREFEASQKLGFSVEYTLDAEATGSSRLVWNHLKMGLVVSEENLTVTIATADQGLKWIRVEDAGLVAGAANRVTVLADAEADRLQVIVNDRLVLEDTATDLAFAGAGGREWGWHLGTPWGHWFAGEIHDFQVSDSFEFLDTPRFHEDALLLG